MSPSEVNTIQRRQCQFIYLKFPICKYIEMAEWLGTPVKKIGIYRLWVRILDKTLILRKKRAKCDIIFLMQKLSPQGRQEVTERSPRHKNELNAMSHFD